MMDGLADGLSMMFMTLLFLAILGVFAIMGGIVTLVVWIFVSAGIWMAYVIGGFTLVGFVLAIIAANKGW